jgi:hypothetical protein
MSDARPANAVRTSRRFNLISAALGFLLWGGWALFVASRAPAGSGAPPVISGLTQGIGSFCITLMMVRSVSWLYQRLSGNVFQLILPAVITVAITGTALATAHSMVGTANIIGTIAPALTVALCFNLFTTFKIRKSATTRQDDVSGDVHE